MRNRCVVQLFFFIQISAQLTASEPQQPSSTQQSANRERVAQKSTIKNENAELSSSQTTMHGSQTVVNLQRYYTEGEGLATDDDTLFYWVCGCCVCGILGGIFYIVSQ